MGRADKSYTYQEFNAALRATEGLFYEYHRYVTLARFPIPDPVVMAGLAKRFDGAVRVYEQVVPEGMRTSRLRFMKEDVVSPRKVNEDGRRIHRYIMKQVRALKI